MSIKNERERLRTTPQLGRRDIKNIHPHKNSRIGAKQKHAKHDTGACEELIRVRNQRTTTDAAISN